MDKKERNRALFLAFLGVVGAVLLFTIKQPERMERYECGGVAWATAYKIVYFHEADLADSVQAVLREFELSVSPFNRHSRLSAVNDNTDPTVDGYLQVLYEVSKEVNALTYGAFDPTLSPLINAWGFGYKSGQLPDAAAVDSLLEFVGINKTRLENGRIIKSDARTTFDFSAIAKGYGCDAIAQMFVRNGVENFLIEIGGEVVAKGVNGDGKKWVVSIVKPEAVEGGISQESMLYMNVTNCGIATSGNYRNFKTDAQGNRFGHIINPVTGYPEQTDILSVTVIAPDCMYADAYATAFMVMGLEKSREFLESHPELAAAFIVGDFQVVKTANFPE